MTLKERKQQLLSDFSMLPTWEDRYAYLIHLGQELPPLLQEEKTDETLVRGCQSRAWLIVEQKGDSVEIRGDAEGLITKGVIGLLAHMLMGVSKEDLDAEDFSFLEQLEIAKHLSPNRANGFAAMIGRIKKQKNAIGV